MIDLGPGDGEARQKLQAALVAGGLEPVIGDGVDDALAGIATDKDTVLLAAAMADAQSKFGALSCPDATTAAQTAIAIGSARQAAGLAVPELARAWAYVLLCADRSNDTPAALVAAARLRVLGGSPDVAANVLARYPDIDALSNRETIEIEVQAEVAAAEVWIDGARAGTSPMKVVLATGPHVIAAASGTKRGVVTGTVIRKQPVVTVPMPDQASPHATLAARVRSWNGAMPKPAALAKVLDEVDARIALVRHGDTVEAWGHAGLGEPLRRLGDDDGMRPLAEADALVALVADRVLTWSDRAPDPDQPLLRETPLERRARDRGKEEDEPTKWWVYATVGAAILAGGIVIYAHETADNTQRVELHFP